MPIASTNHRGEWNLHYWWETKCSAELTLLWTCLMFLFQKKNQKLITKRGWWSILWWRILLNLNRFFAHQTFSDSLFEDAWVVFMQNKRIVTRYVEAATILFSFKNVQFLWYTASKAMQKMFYIVWIGRWCWTHQYIERTWSSQLTEARNM